MKEGITFQPLAKIKGRIKEGFIWLIDFECFSSYSAISKAGAALHGDGKY